MRESKVVQTVREYRDALEKNERSALISLAKEWMHVQFSLKNDIETLAYIIEERTEAGEPIPIQFLFGLDSYRAMVNHTKEQMETYNQKAYGIIASGQQANLELGLNSANDAIGALGVGVDWDRLNVEEFEIMVGMTSSGAPLAELLAKDYAESVQGITRALTTGIARGWSHGELVKAMMSGANIGFDRSTVIARTEMNRAYRMANIEQYRQSGVVQGFRRLVYKPTACFACLMMDGDFYKLERELDDHPNGRCCAVPCLSKNDVIDWETGREWFERLDLEKQKEIMGLSRFAAWKEGKAELKDFATMHWSDIWGGSPSIKNLADIGVEKAGTDRKLYYNNYVKEPQITKVIKDIAEIVGTEPFGLDYRTKGIRRYLEKFEQDKKEKGRIPEINDVVRYTYLGTVDTMVDMAKKAMVQLEVQGYQTIKIKNFWINGDGTYKGVNTIVMTPEGIKFELQYHTYESIDVKEAKGLHKLFEQFRVMPDKGTSEGIALENKMIEMSSKLVPPIGIDQIEEK